MTECVSVTAVCVSMSNQCVSVCRVVTVCVCACVSVRERECVCVSVCSMLFMLGPKATYVSVSVHEVQVSVGRVFQSVLAFSVTDNGMYYL